MKLSDFALAPAADLARLEKLETENAKLRAALTGISLMVLPHNSEDLLSERMRKFAKAALED